MYDGYTTSPCFINNKRQFSNTSANQRMKIGGFRLRSGSHLSKVVLRTKIQKTFNSINNHSLIREQF